MTSARALASAALVAAATTAVGGQDRWFSSGRAAVEQALLVQPAGDRARNVILFVGDGMGISTVTAARILEGQRRGGPGEENVLAFEQLPYLALSKTYSVNQQVADSAPTATAMMTGVKTNDAVIGLDERAVHGQHATAAGHELTTLLELAEDAGLGTGIVTTARLTHATPAAAYARTVERDWEDDAALSPAARRDGFPDIAKQLVQFSRGDGIDVALGGGRSHFLPRATADPEYPRLEGRRRDGRNLVEEWTARYPYGTYVWNRAGFDAADPARVERLFGLFEPSHMQYEHDRPRDAAGEPSLTEMTAKAIDILSRNGKGYFLMVEGGRIDHGHHAGNAYRALTDTIELSNAVRAARARTSPADTLIVVTADHSHTLTIGGNATRGNPILGPVMDNTPDGKPAGELEVDLLGRAYTTLGYRNGQGYFDARRRFDVAFADTSDPDYRQDALTPLVQETHAGEDVAIYAGGPAAHLFRGVLEQHVIFHVMAHALRLAPGDPAAVVERFLARQDAPLQSYRATRRMEARNPRFNKEAWADVATEFSAAHGLTYTVVASGGSSLVINRVLLPALRSEAEMWRTGEPARYGLTRANYAFSAAAPEAGAVRVPVRALGKHVLLINGSLLLSPEDGDLLRVEGRLSKSPSFWVSRVEVVRRYARLAGVRVPVELESVAHVRLAGRSEMRITYQYSSINGEHVAH